MSLTKKSQFFEAELHSTQLSNHLDHFSFCPFQSLWWYGIQCTYTQTRVDTSKCRSSMISSTKTLIAITSCFRFILVSLSKVPNVLKMPLLFIQSIFFFNFFIAFPWFCRLFFSLLHKMSYNFGYFTNCLFSSSLYFLSLKISNIFYGGTL